MTKDPTKQSPVMYNIITISGIYTPKMNFFENILSYYKKTIIEFFLALRNNCTSFFI
tara:strand:- start:3721 stop:3891 length:171 start_codon:yes stop_codon:yes gene_type:complete